jgi:hypothetical protein
LCSSSAAFFDPAGNQVWVGSCAAAEFGGVAGSGLVWLAFAGTQEDARHLSEQIGAAVRDLLEIGNCRNNGLVVGCLPTGVMLGGASQPSDDYPIVHLF